MNATTDHQLIEPSSLLQTFLASILIAVGNIDGFISAFNAMSWLQYGAAIFGIIIMRITCPDQPRPYKVTVT